MSAFAGDCESDQLALAPLIPDTLAFGLGLFNRILGAQHALRGFSEHHVDDPFLINLVDGGVGVTRVADVGGPTQHILQDLYTCQAG